MGDVYAPHDLGSVEMGKWKGRGGRGMGAGKGIGGGRGREWGDVVDVLGVRPVVEYKVRTPPFFLWAYSFLQWGEGNGEREGRLTKGRISR